MDRANYFEELIKQSFKDILSSLSKDFTNEFSSAEKIKSLKNIHERINFLFIINRKIYQVIKIETSRYALIKLKKLSKKVININDIVNSQIDGFYDAGILINKTKWGKSNILKRKKIHDRKLLEEKK